MDFQSLQDEINQRVQPEVPPTPPHPVAKAFYILAILTVLGGSSFALYKYGEIYLHLTYGGGLDTAVNVIETRAKITDALAGLPNVTARDIAQGFWYTHTDEQGNDSVLFFDADAFARQGLSADQIAELAATVGHSRVLSRGNMRDVAEEDLPPELRFHNELYSFGVNGRSTLDIASELQDKVAAKTATADDLFQLSYVAELNGDYATRDALNAQNCTQFKERCGDALTVFLEGKIIDSAGNGIQGARVEVVSRPDLPSVLTDAKGVYTIKTGAKRMEKMRVRASKRNYSDGLADVVVLTSEKKLFVVDSITLEAPINIVTIDYAKKTVTGAGNTFNADGSVVIHTSQSTYEIPPGAILENGRPYAKGPIDVYLYEFTKGDPPESLMQIDTFDQVVGYAGNLMKTFGMPYIQFFTENGVELDVVKSKSMVLTYKIADMEALRTNQDKIYKELTDADMQTLVAASIGVPYAIDRQFLINNGLLQFPAFWVFDRGRGVWDNVGVSVLDTEGTIRSPFYTIRDDI